MKPCVSAEMLNKLFSSDLKQALQGIAAMSSWVDTNLPDLIESLDLVFKWIWAKLFEASNTQLVKAVIELTDKLLIALQSAVYSLPEAEANLLLPVLCERSGHNNALFRTMLRATILKTLGICDVRMVVNYLIAALNSRNSRTKAEVQETLALVIKEHGMLLAPKEVKQIVGLVGGSDIAVRQSAIAVMAEVYALTLSEHHARTSEADRVITQLIGEVPDKVKDLLKQRFKAVAKEQGLDSREETEASRTFERSDLSMNTDTAEELRTEVQKVDPSPSKVLPRPSFTPKSSFIRSPTPPSVRKGPFTPKTSENSALSVSQEVKDEASSFDIATPMKSDTSTEPIAPTSPEAESTIRLATLEAENLDEADEKLRDLIVTIKEGSMSSKVDALVGVDSFLKGTSFSHLHALTTQANALVESVTRSLASTFERTKESLPHRFAKYLLAIAHKITCNKQVMIELNETTLGSLLNQTLQTMLVENLSTLGEKGEGEAMFKSLNNMILRILENGQPTLVLVVQLRLLRVYTVGNEKLMALVLKCLLKYVQVLPRMALDIDLSYFAVVMRDIFNERPQKFDERVRRALVDLLEEMKRVRGAELEAAVPELVAWIAALVDSTLQTQTSASSLRKSSIPTFEKKKSDPKLENLSMNMTLSQSTDFDIGRIQSRLTALKHATGRETAQGDNTISDIRSRLARMMQSTTK